MFVKGLDFLFKKSSIRSLYSGLSYLSFNFVRDSKVNVFVSPTSLDIKLYKCKLKIIIKSFYNLPFISLIDSLNLEISKWCANFGNFRCSLNLFISLDFYLYKLLWKFCKRLHPRRSNSWIFEKYWKNLSGNFRFFFVNPLTGRFYFLDSHLQVDRSLKRFPASICFFDYRDNKKIYFDYFKKFRRRFSGVYGVLFDIQKGICPLCNRLFWNSNLNNLLVIDFTNSSDFKNIFHYYYHLILVHKSCFLN